MGSRSWVVPVELNQSMYNSHIPIVWGRKPFTNVFSHSQALMLFSHPSHGLPENVKNLSKESFFWPVSLSDQIRFSVPFISFISTPGWFITTRNLKHHVGNYTYHTWMVWDV